MKSPWKFLAQLLPQRQPAETRERPIEQDADTDRSGGEALDTFPLKSTEASSESEHGEGGVATAAFDPRDPAADASQAAPEHMDVEPVEGPAHRSRSRSPVDRGTLQVDGDTTKRRARPPRQRKPAHANSTRADVVQTNAVADRDQPAKVSSRESFFDEVAGVDEEIRQLKVRLTQKLHLQNAQLKKMLERFDRS
jgi:hypothetical protein